jgi:tryptophan synthase alpha chain
MGYLNPVEVMGYAAFAEAAAAAGVDGVLTVDLPPEEAEPLSKELRARGLDPIYLLAPTTPPERIRLITAAASGYVYFRAVSGLPIGVGFGIKDASSAAAVAAHADGVVVGSVLVDAIGRRQDDVDAIPAALAAILQDMRQAMDRR